MDVTDGERSNAVSTPVVGAHMEVKELRERAARNRKIAAIISDEQTADRLRDAADEAEKRADELEAESRKRSAPADQ